MWASMFVWEGRVSDVGKTYSGFPRFRLLEKGYVGLGPAKDFGCPASGFQKHEVLERCTGFRA